jgi:hypothetical protein
MKATRTVLYVLLMSACTLAAGQPRGFAPDRIDYYGFVGWEDLGPLSPGASKGLTQMWGGQLGLAYTQFSTAWSQDPGDFHDLHGMVQTAARLGRLPELYLRLNREESQRRSRLEKGQPEHLFAILYTRNVAHYFRPAGSGPALDGGTTWDQEALQVLQGGTIRDRRYAIMLSGALLADGRVADARRAAMAGLRNFPDFHALKLHLALSYREGTVRQWQGSKEVPVSRHERPDPARYEQLVLEVVRDAPNFRYAQYEAGMALQGKDPGRARAHLNRFLQMEREPTARRKNALETLARLPGS